MHVGKVIGPIAKPDDIRFADALPKTRSGKIMRRLLKQIAVRRSRHRRHHDARGLQRPYKIAGGERRIASLPLVWINPLYLCVSEPCESILF